MALTVVWVIGFVLVFLIWPKVIQQLEKTLRKTYESGDIEKLGQQLKWAVPLSLESGRILLLRAHFHFNQGDYPRTFDDLGLILKRRPENTVARMYRAAVYGSLGQYEESLEDYEDVIFYSPNHSEAYNWAIRVHILLGQLDAAQTHANELVSRQPDRSSSYFRRASVYTSRNQLDLALADYAKGIELDTENVGALSKTLNLHSSRGDIAKAREALVRIQEINPDSVAPYGARILLDIEEGLIDTALDDADALVERFSDDAKAHYYRGVVFILFSQFDRAEQSLATATDIDAKNTSVLITIGDLKFHQQKYDEASSFYLRALEIDEFRHSARARLAVVRQQLGQHSSAVNDWRYVTARDRRFSDPAWLREEFDPFEKQLEIALKLVEETTQATDAE